MSRWLYLVAGATLAVLGLSPHPAVSQAEAVDLQLKFTPGETLYYSETGSFQGTFEFPGSRTVDDSRYTTRPVIRVLEVGALGVMLVEFVLEDYRLTTAGRAVDRTDTPWTFKVDPHGKIVEKIVAPELLEDFPYALPGRPVRVGESWTRQATFTQAGLAGQGVGTFTLAGVDRVGDGRVARVQYRIEGAVPIPPGTQLLRLPGLQSRTRGSMRATGEFQWSVDQGRVVRGLDEMLIDIDSIVTYQDESARLRLTSRYTSRREALSADSIPVPSVSPDRLVAPGKGIGPFVLTMTVDDLTKCLGDLDFRVLDLGFIAWSRIWRNGLVGYVDGDDQDKLVGLEIADRRYRTDKGIGFGSSQGAVLMAHGMPPTRVEMSIPRAGSRASAHL